MPAGFILSDAERVKKFLRAGLMIAVMRIENIGLITPLLALFCRRASVGYFVFVFTLGVFRRCRTDADRSVGMRPSCPRMGKTSLINFSSVQLSLHLGTRLILDADILPLELFN